MKKMIKYFGAFALAAVLFSACKDDNPVNNDLFVGTYEGTLTYDGPDQNDETTTTDGRVTVAKFGNKYNFAFSNGIPDINGVEFEKEDSEYYISVGNSATDYIRINASQLDILRIKDGAKWTADCSR